MNVIRKHFWFMFIYLLDYPANTMKQETFHQVKWWYIWKCLLLCQVPAMTPSGSSELDNTEMVNSLKCCKWKVSSILWSNHQHQQRPSERWGNTRKKGIQIMFSSTQNSTQDPPGTLWEDSLCLFLIWSVGSFKCHKQIFWFMLMDFSDATKHHDIKKLHQVKW